MNAFSARTGTTWCLLAFSCLAFLGCQNGPAPVQDDPTKVPITTSSEEARDKYLDGRELLEKLRATDAREHYKEAVALDPDFGMAQLAMATTAPTANEFWESLGAAVASADKLSEAERHTILAFDAGARGDVAAQKEHLDRLVESYPEDERALNALGQYHFGRQEWDLAIEHYERAASINPDFSQIYNQLGYARRFLRDYDGAEAAFLKYIDLIPGEPNPHDSYAELLMKLGRFEESIEHYEKALELDPRFIASYVGIGNNQIFMGRGDEARETFAKLMDVARNDGEKRQALLWSAASYVHEGRTDEALGVLSERHEIAKATSDFPAMAGDLVLEGMVLLEAGRIDEAWDRFQGAIKRMDVSDSPQDNKDNFRRNHLYREARIAIARGDLQTAEDRAATYGEQIQEHGILFEQWLHHELLGLIAMARGDHATAVEQLTQANVQNPRVLYLTALANDGKGDKEQARETCERAANFNGLSFNYAYVRASAQEMLAGS